MKFELNRLSEYTKETIIAELQRVAKLVSSDKLSISEFSKHSKVGLTTVRRKFGNWENALSSAGLEHLYNKPNITEKVRKQNARNMTDEELVSQIKYVSEILGKKRITVQEFNDFSNINVDSLRRRFGSWNNALTMAGCDIVKHGKRYTDEECFENLLNVWTHYGRPPKYKEMNEIPSVVGPKAYIVRWKTWNNALHAFVAFTNEEPENIYEVKTVKESPQPIEVKKKQADKRDIPMGLRYKVLCRDNFRCVLCGRSPAIELGVELHIDHIIPFSKGGKTVIENLRCTCKECNLGKGSKIENDLK